MMLVDKLIDMFDQFDYVFPFRGRKGRPNAFPVFFWKSRYIIFFVFTSSKTCESQFCIFYFVWKFIAFSIVQEKDIGPPRQPRTGGRSSYLEHLLSVSSDDGEDGEEEDMRTLAFFDDLVM